MNSYPKDWYYIAYSVKSLAGWRCEVCNHKHDPASGHCLTVHHLDGDKSNCNFSNLLAACQRCHLHIQSRWRPGQTSLSLYDPPEWAVKRGFVC